LVRTEQQRKYLLKEGKEIFVNWKTIKALFSTFVNRLFGVETNESEFFLFSVPGQMKTIFLVSAQIYKSLWHRFSIFLHFFFCCLFNEEIVFSFKWLSVRKKKWTEMRFRNIQYFHSTAHIFSYFFYSRKVKTLIKICCCRKVHLTLHHRRHTHHHFFIIFLLAVSCDCCD
jgi:hypothetical protein